MAAPVIPLRVSIFPMGQLVSIGDDTTIGGVFGHYFQEHHDHYNEFNRTYVWVTDNTLTGSKINATMYTGVLEQMQHNLSDSLLIPNPRSPDTEIAEFGLHMLNSPVIVVSPLDIHSYPDQILKQLFRFSVDIVFLLLITMYIFARVLRKCEIRRNSHGVLDGVWHMIRMMLNQVQVSPLTHAGRILIALTVVGVFFWLQLWQNQMKMEMIAFDTSLVIRNLDEAAAANKTLVMTKTEAATLAVEQKAFDNPDTSLGKLYKKAILNTRPSSQIVNMLSSMEDLTQEKLSRHVIVVSAHLVKFVEGFICMSLKSANPNFNFLYGDEVVVDIPTGPWYNPHLNPEYKAIIRKKSLRIKDHGLDTFFAELMTRETQRITRMHLPGLDTQCVFQTVNEFISLRMSYKNSAITVDQLSDVFRLLCYATSGALIVLFLEAFGFMVVFRSKFLMLQERMLAPRQRRRIAWAERGVWKQLFPGHGNFVSRVSRIKITIGRKS